LDVYSADSWAVLRAAKKAETKVGSKAALSASAWVVSMAGCLAELRVVHSVNVKAVSMADSTVAAKVGSWVVVTVAMMELKMAVYWAGRSAA